MLIWLASYPRSGSGLLRLILNRCFGLNSYDIYAGQRRADGEAPRGFKHRPHLELMGATEWHDASREALVERAKLSSDTFLLGRMTCRIQAPPSTSCGMVVPASPRISGFSRRVAI